MKVSETVRVAIHEAGHAVVALLFCPERIIQVTIIPGVFQEQPLTPPKPYLGLLTLLPFNPIGSRSDLLRAQLVTWLGGYVAEQLVLGDIGLGAAHDLIAVGRISHELAKARLTSVDDRQISLPSSHSSDPEIADAVACVQHVLATERRLHSVVTEALLARRTLSRYDLHVLYLRTRS